MITRGDNAEIPFRQFTTLLRRQWKLITAFALAGLTGAVLLGSLLPERYTAKAQLLVSHSESGAAERPDDTAVDTHVALLTSPSHLRRVWESLSHLQYATEEPGQDFAPDWNIIEDVLPDGQEPLSFEELEKHLGVYKERFSRVISITFTWTDPRTAATVANRVAELYVQAGRDRAQAEHDIAEARLSERIPAARAELERAEAAVREYRLASGLVDTERLQTMDLQIAELKRRLERNSSELSEYDERLSLLSRLREEASGEQGNGSRALGEALGDPWFARFRPPAALGAGPAAVGPDEASESEGVARLADQVIAQLAVEREAIEARGFSIRDELEALERSRQATRQPEQRLRALEREATAAAQFYENLLQRKTDLAAKGAIAADTRVVSAASVPELPSSPSPMLFILPALVIAGIAGGFASLLVERLDHRLRSEGDIERTLGLTCIGLVPRTAAVTRQGLQNTLINSPFDPYTEAIRSLVTAAFMQLSREPMVFLVTSSRRGEGKTALAVSFALYAALLRRRVLLIDLNFHNPAISRALQGKDELGIMDARGERTSHDVIKKVPELGIDYLPLSEEEGYPLSILSTDRLPKILDELKSRYECIVIDTSPLLGTAEARLFASLADKVIFAVKWGAVDHDIASGALNELRHAGIENVAEFASAVVTQVDMRRHIFCRYGAAGDAGVLSRDPRPPSIPRIPIRNHPFVRSPAA